jgi:hypothetical protein
LPSSITADIDDCFTFSSPLRHYARARYAARQENAVPEMLRAMPAMLALPLPLMFDAGCLFSLFRRRHAD